MPLDQALQDDDRIEFFRGSAEALLAAVSEDGVDIKAYFPWSEDLFPYLREAVSVISEIQQHD